MKTKAEREWLKSEKERKRKARLKRNDKRPVCYCDAYKFPHKIGGKCTGKSFASFYFYNDAELCEQCNCYDDSFPMSCDVVSGTEDIKHGECYMERLHQFPKEKLPLELMFEEE